MLHTPVNLCSCLHLAPLRHNVSYHYHLVFTRLILPALDLLREQCLHGNDKILAIDRILGRMTYHNSKVFKYAITLTEDDSKFQGCGKRSDESVVSGYSVILQAVPS